MLLNQRALQLLNFTVWDAEEKMELNVPSRNTKVKITNELLSKLKEKHVSYKLN